MIGSIKRLISLMFLSFSFCALTFPFELKPYKDINWTTKHGFKIIINIAYDTDILTLEEIFNNLQKTFDEAAFQAVNSSCLPEDAQGCIKKTVAKK